MNSALLGEEQLERGGQRKNRGIVGEGEDRGKNPVLLGEEQLEKGRTGERTQLY